KMHNWTTENLKAGIPADRIPKQFLQMFKDAGYEKNYVYGPCHGTGMIEVEAPWMETSSDYMLKENMTFQVDTFVSGSTFGCRWEKGIAIKENGVESYTDYLEKHGLIELGF
ncbi:MAG: M24 family metallopeptidase, partial [Clostridia bacterium]|nr:M24 family metallopeptidase [Clostridia bacterium]